MKFTVTIQGPDTNKEGGSFEVVGVDGMKRTGDLPGPLLKAEEMRSVNILMVWTEFSPGHWCVVGGRRFWCP